MNVTMRETAITRRWILRLDTGWTPHGCPSHFETRGEAVAYAVERGWGITEKHFTR